jgi:arylsulfatase A-like enzyme
VLAGPGIPEGQRIASPVYLQDVMPTTLELAGAEIPHHVDFRSMLPVIRGEGDGYPAIYGAYLEGQRCIIEEGWKLILYPRVPEHRLYDLSSDPAETVDLSREHPEKAKALFRRFLELQAEMEDEAELRTPFPDLAEFR